MKTYRVGIVGLTGIASAAPSIPEKTILRSPMPTSHASAYAVLPQTRVVAVCDLVPERREEFVRRWGHVWSPIATYADYREMLAKESLDILSVVTSDHRHADIVVEAAEAGVRGIFCEKPIATSLEDADRMIEAVERKKAILSVDHTRRWNPIYHKAKELVRLGAIGRLRLIVGNLGGPRAMLFRNGTHLIDTICFFAEADPEWVMAELDEGYEDYWEYRGDGGHDPTTEPGALAYIHFKNGVRAFYNGTRPSVPDFSLELMGSEGRIHVDDAGLELYTLDSKSGGLVHRTVRLEAYMKSGIVAAIEELIELMEKGGYGISDGREARKALEIIIAMLESQRRGNSKVWLPMPRKA
ncbi:MAG: Gfo/Idh/MocA family oxidoreductase [Candidatus Bathyarchaeia archaeon]